MKIGGNMYLFLKTNKYNYLLFLKKIVYIYKYGY